MNESLHNPEEYIRVLVSDLQTSDEEKALLIRVCMRQQHGTLTFENEREATHISIGQDIPVAHIMHALSQVVPHFKSSPCSIMFESE